MVCQKHVATSSLHVDIIRDYRRINSYMCTVAYPLLDTRKDENDKRIKGRSMTNNLKNEYIKNFGKMNGLSNLAKGDLDIYTPIDGSKIASVQMNNT